MDRLEEVKRDLNLEDRIRQVGMRVSEACRRSGRSREEIRIVAVTKYASLELTEQIIERGFDQIGENRWQDAREKWMRIGDRAVWHFLGRLQTNKVKDVVGKFEYIHSIDRLNLAEAIDRKAAALGVTVNGFIQVNVSGEATKTGVAPDELMTFADQLKDLQHLRIVGLMTMAPHEADPERTRPVFRRLRELRDQMNASAILPYKAADLSMGMSNDFEIAIEEGATWIRLGSVLAGNEGG